MLTAGQHQGNAVRPHLKLDVIRQPHPDAKREAHQALDELVLCRELAVMPGSVDQEDPIAALIRTLLPEDQKAGGDGCTVENVLWKGYDSIDETRFKESPPDEVLVVGLAMPDLRLATSVEFARLLLELGLAAEEDALGAYYAGAAVDGE